MKQARAAWPSGLGSLAVSGLLAACGPTTAGEPTAPPNASAAPTPNPSPSASPSPALPEIGRGIGAPRFEERFDGPSLAPEVWRFLPGPGKQAFPNGAMRLYVEGKGTAFPYAYTRPAIIPANGPWAVEWSFDPSKMSWGQAFALDYFPPTGFDFQGLASPYLTVGMLNERAQFSSSLLGGVFYSEGLAFDTFHTIRVGGDDASATIYIDGKFFGKITSERRPARFWMGTSPPKNGLWQTWGELRIDHLVAGALTRSVSEDPPSSAPMAAPAASGVASPQP